MTRWYEDEKKVTELAEFLVQSAEIVNVDELLEYFKHPDRYTEVWSIYEKEILGTIQIPLDISKKVQSYELKQRHTRSAPSVSCACGIV